MESTKKKSKKGLGNCTFIHEVATEEQAKADPSLQ